uniref:Uncharacterized protein n=1 Tax=Tetraselmis sp. GSL018 TaxID=582737 RepID=A0A061R2F4_9CHLO|eukprot:CAMPEP_0177606408 /NCGR_PEP_ID=MMETSP0419_2-20121207/17291_1 /TAXON_ID=582737 /ORGANISM="Tetraselmis sp., Strain GSL018" /LENGTH=227 /DNA_ID=CAMNT_0019100767 /DNA_START=246 /DNA_END=929 /DNA_ORIENTATION=+
MLSLSAKPPWRRKKKQEEQQRAAMEMEMQRELERQQQELRQKQQHTHEERESSLSRILKRHGNAALASVKLSQPINRSSPEGSGDRGEASPKRGTFDQAHAIEEATEDARLDRRLEAVFVSFALFGRWCPEEMVAPRPCAGMSANRLVALLSEAGLVDGKRITSELVVEIFEGMRDKTTMKLGFEQFLEALSSVSERARRSEESVLAAILSINSEGLLRIHFDPGKC